MASRAEFRFLLYGTNPCEQDSRDFVYGVLASTGIVDEVFPASIPGLIQLSSVIEDPQHPMLRLSLTITGPAATGSVYAVFSADLVGHCGA